MLPKLGIFAGDGSLPGRLVEQSRAVGRDCFVVALEGHADPDLLIDTPTKYIRIGAAGRIIQAFKDEKVEQLVLVGPVKRPSMVTVWPDWRGLKFLLRAGWRAFRGDDTLLKAVAEELEIEGFTVLGVHDLLEDLLAPSGVMGSVTPANGASDDVEIGVREARRIGKLDIGQAVVVNNGRVVATENEAGTNDLLKRAGERDGNGAILVKIKKPQQDRRLDLPTIGVETVTTAAALGFSGIVVDAHNTLIVDRIETINAADAAGLFLLGIDTSNEQ